jgi:AcrR family transcriptional regulator
MLAARKSPKRRATRLRDSERTRERLLQAASREIYRSGFQSASVDTILAVAGVTKDYHFDSKEALGHAVIDEVIATDVRGKWVRPLIAMVEGYASLAKNAQDPKVMKAGIRNIVGWLRSLRAPGNRRG